MKSQIRILKILAEKGYYAGVRGIKPQRYFGLGLLLILSLFAGARSAAAQVRDLFNNTNTAAVRNGGTINPQFSLNVPTRITQVVTYHWNSGRGARPGAIGLRNNNNGQVFRFAATGVAGYGGAPNVNWVATPNVNVPAGSYTVLDSDPGTWSSNPQSASQGFAIVRGSALTPPPLPPFRTPGNPRTTTPVPPDRGSNNPDTATLLIPVSSMPRPSPNLPAQQRIADGIGGSDTDDWYFLNVTGPNGSQQSRGVLFVIGGFSGNVQLELLPERSRRPMFIGGPQGSRQKSISQSLAPGNYLVHVTWTGPPTTYQLTISTP